MVSLSQTIHAAQQGDREAFAELVRSYWAGVYGLCSGYARDRWMAEDLAQETFLRAYLHLGELRDPEGFWPWLRRVARNTSLMAHRADREAKNVPLGDRLDNVAEPPGELGALPLRDLLHRVLADLPEAYRLPLCLCYLSGTSYREAAHLLGVPEALVRSRLFEARRRLRQKFQSTAEEILRQSAGLSEPEVDAIVSQCQGSAACRCGRTLLGP